MEKIFERYENVKKNIILLYQRRLWTEKEAEDINGLKNTLAEFSEKTVPKIITTMSEEKRHAKDEMDILKLLIEQLRVIDMIKSYCKIIVSLGDKWLILTKIQKLFEAFGSFMRVSDKIIDLSKMIRVPKNKSLDEKLRKAI